jgi:hypothetical protein
VDGGTKNGAKGIRMEERMLAGPSPFLLHLALLCIVCRGSDKQAVGSGGHKTRIRCFSGWPLGVA